MTFNYTRPSQGNGRSPNFAAFSWDKAPHATPNHTECCVCAVHLKNHMVSHEERRFMCPSCNYRAARKTNLEAHMLAQHGTNRKLYRCTEPCQYATGYDSNLRKHQRLFCKYRRQNSNCTMSSVNASGTVTDMVLENETATVTGISRANGSVASSWHVWSGSVLNSFSVSTDSQAIQDMFEQCGTK